MSDEETLVKTFDLSPHPEGGFFKETYRSTLGLDDIQSNMPGMRNISTAIYFLLGKNDRSVFHRIKSDELWHFYSGGPLSIYEITETGELEHSILGNRPGKGEKFQHCVAAGRWFASRPYGNHFSFVGCTVAPGFDFSDFEIAERSSLLKEFPQHEEIITSLTPS